MEEGYEYDFKDVMGPDGVEHGYYYSGPIPRDQFGDQTTDDNDHGNFDFSVEVTFMDVKTKQLR